MAKKSKPKATRKSERNDVRQKEKEKAVEQEKKKWKRRNVRVFKPRKIIGKNNIIVDRIVPKISLPPELKQEIVIKEENPDYEIILDNGEELPSTSYAAYHQHHEINAAPSAMDSLDNMIEASEVFVSNIKHEENKNGADNDNNVEDSLEDQCIGIVMEHGGVNVEKPMISDNSLIDDGIRIVSIKSVSVQNKEHCHGDNCDGEQSDNGCMETNHELIKDTSAASTESMDDTGSTSGMQHIIISLQTEGHEKQQPTTALPVADKGTDCDVTETLHPLLNGVFSQVVSEASVNVCKNEAYFNEEYGNDEDIADGEGSAVGDIGMDMEHEQEEDKSDVQGESVVLSGSNSGAQTSSTSVQTESNELEPLKTVASGAWEKRIVGQRENVVPTQISTTSTTASGQRLQASESKRLRTKIRAFEKQLKERRSAKRALEKTIIELSMELSSVDKKRSKHCSEPIEMKNAYSQTESEPNLGICLSDIFSSIPITGAPKIPATLSPQEISAYEQKLKDALEKYVDEHISRLKMKVNGESPNSCLTKSFPEIVAQSAATSNTDATTLRNTDPALYTQRSLRPNDSRSSSVASSSHSSSSFESSNVSSQNVEVHGREDNSETLPSTKNTLVAHSLVKSNNGMDGGKTDKHSLCGSKCHSMTQTIKPGGQAKFNTRLCSVMFSESQEPEGIYRAKLSTWCHPDVCTSSLPAGKDGFVDERTIHIEKILVYRCELEYGAYIQLKKRLSDSSLKSKYNSLISRKTIKGDCGFVQRKIQPAYVPRRGFYHYEVGCHPPSTKGVRPTTYAEHFP